MNKDKVLHTIDFCENGDGFVFDYFTTYLRISYFEDHHFRDKIIVMLEDVTELWKFMT